MFSGGGTGGSVTPLLAVAEELLKDNPDFNLIFVGTPDGPEREMVASFNSRIGKLKFIPLASGKWRRYFSLANFLDLFKIIAAWFKSFALLRQAKPDLLVSAGSFVSVPVVWAAAFRKIPILIHQQDVRPGLANKLMAPFARVITVTFEKSLLDYGSRAVWIGNPVKELLSGDAKKSAPIREKYGLTGGRPFIFVTGGGTGSSAINKLIFSAAPQLTEFCQIIHLTGRGKMPVEKINSVNYHLREFLSNHEVLALMDQADLVVSRAGLAALTELSALNKPAIIIPLPHSHQEDNAVVFKEAGAAIVLDQNELTPDKLVTEIRRIWADQSRRAELGKNIGKVIKRGATENMISIMEEMLGK